MDTSVIDATKVTKENGLLVGNHSAPIKMVEFVNVRCPFCKKWFEESYDLLKDYVNNGQVQRVIKFFDKEKVSLQPGNIMHQYINYASPEKDFTDLKKIYDTQEQWGNLSLPEVAAFAEQQLQLTKQAQPAITQAVIAEAAEANIRFVPTIVVDEHIFDESIARAELIQYLTAD